MLMRFRMYPLWRAFLKVPFSVLENIVLLWTGEKRDKHLRFEIVSGLVKKGPECIRSQLLTFRDSRAR